MRPIMSWQLRPAALLCGLALLDAAAGADVQSILRDAEAGNPLAQHTLGAMYETGRGVPRDDALCARWWRAAADNGVADAQKNMGSLYFSGRGVPLDYQQSMYWYLKAAEQDHPHAQQYVALGYERGLGLPKDPDKARYWTERVKEHPGVNTAVVFKDSYQQPGNEPKTDADLFRLFEAQAQKGNPRAQFYIGVAYGSGVGVSKDPQRAYQWIRKAAETGVASAQTNLGLMYMLGDGIPADAGEAQKWFLIAKQGDSEMAGYLAQLNGADLKPGDRARAEAAAGTWAGARSSGGDQKP
jgi:TPR repeat protein